MSLCHCSHLLVMKVEKPQQGYDEANIDPRPVNTAPPDPVSYATCAAWLTSCASRSRSPRSSRLVRGPGHGKPIPTLLHQACLESVLSAVSPALEQPYTPM